VLGTFSAAKLSDSRGRKPTMAYSAALFVFASLLMCWTPNLEILVLSRFLAGVGIGNCGAVVPVYVAECASAASRGALATLPQLMISSGTLAGLVVTFVAAVARSSPSFASPALAARVVLGATLVPSLVYAVLVANLPESPRHLVRTGDGKAAAAALKRLRGRDAASELRELTKAAAREASSETSGGWNTLLKPRVRRRLGACVLLQIFQQFTGINAIVYFTPQLLKESGTVAALGARLGVSDDAAALLATVATYVPKIPAMFGTMLLMDAWGRRKLLAVFVPVMGACLAALGYALDAKAAFATPLALAAVALYGVAFNLSLGPVPNIYTAESFPARARSAAMTTSLTAQFAAHSAVSFFFPVIVASRGAAAALYGFAGVCGACWLFANLGMAETKAASLEEIASELES